MNRHSGTAVCRRVAASVSVVAVGCTCAAPAALGAVRALTPVTISGPIPRLSRCGLNGDDNTPQLVADPAHPARLVATYFSGDDRAAVAAVSTDGGRDWTRSVLPGLTTCTGGPPGQLVDPSLGFSADGSILATPGWVKSSPELTDRDHDAIREYVSRSRDGGLTWARPVDIGPAMPYQRGLVTQGPLGDELLETEKAPFAATTYEYGAPGGIDVVSSSDAGRSWKRTAALPGVPGFATFAVGILRSRGLVVALAVRANVATALPSLAAGAAGVGDGSVSASLVAAVSHDGGRTFGRASVIADCGGGLTCDFPRATTAPDGRLLIAYTAKRLDGTYVLRVTSSEDGTHWTAHDVCALPRAPEVAALAADRRHIAVLELERDVANPNLEYAVLHLSPTIGHTWRRMTLAGPFDLKTITYTHFDGQLGPEIDLAALPDGFGAVYPVLKPYPLIDGEQDVVFQRVLDIATARRRAGGRHSRCGRRP